MKQLDFTVALLLVFWLGSTAFGQGDDLIIVPPEAFTEAAVRLDLPGDVPPILSPLAPGIPEERIFYKWGVTLRGSGPTSPAVKYAYTGAQFTPHLWTISNSGSPNAGEPMIIDFDIPVRRVSFSLVSDPEEAKVSAFDSKGAMLGSIEGAQLIGRTRLESTAVEGISKLVVDYGDVEKEEEIFKLLVEFVSGPPVFELYVPQVADGQLPGVSSVASLQSELRVSNLQADCVNVKDLIGVFPAFCVGFSESPLRTIGTVDFFDSHGQPLELNVESFGKTASGTNPSSSIEFSLDPTETLVIRTGGNTNPLAYGYARIRADGPVAATAGYTVLGEQGETITEAGIGAVGALLQSMSAVESNPGTSSETALALLNPSDEKTANLRIFLIFDYLPDSAEVKEISLGPGQHLASFVTDLFPSATEEFEGSLYVSADRPIAATTLRTQNGLPLSSLQLESLELANGR